MQQDRTPGGKFAAGNKLSRGNPHCDRIAKLRSAMLAAVTEKNMKAVIKKLVELAEGGDVKAIALLLDRTLGKIDATIVTASQDTASTNQSGLSAVEFAQQYRAARMRREAGLPVASTSAQRMVERIKAERAGMTDEQIEAQRQERLRASGLPPDATPREILASMMARQVADQSYMICVDAGRDDVTLDISSKATP